MKKTIRNYNTLLDNKIIGESDKFRAVMKFAKQVASYDTNILILGETGSGKRVIAEFIHENSPRRDNLFYAINCAAIPETLLEKMFFGSVKEAYTGAVSDKKGFFEMVDNGTLFLDEITELHPGMQAKLLQVIEENIFFKVGDNKPTRVNVRIIAATNKELNDSIESGAFRKDLYYRLDVCTINLPPLRQRIEDILPLANHFAEIFCNRNKIPKKNFIRVESALTSYKWPGNIRELRNAVERAIILSSTDLITLDCLPAIVSDSICKSSVTKGRASSDAQNVSDEEIIKIAKEHNSGHWDNAARELGVSYDKFTELLRIGILKLLNTKSKAEVAKIIGISKPQFYKTWRIKLGLW